MDSYQPPIKVNVVVCGASLTMEVDSMLLAVSFQKKNFQEVVVDTSCPSEYYSEISHMTRDSLKVAGVVNVRVVLGQKEVQCELVVVSGNGPRLLGRNWFQALGLQVSGLYWVQEDLVPFMNEFPDLFKEELGAYKGPDVTLHLRSDASPRFLKACGVPFPIKLQVEKELNRLVKTGVLTPVR